MSFLVKPLTSFNNMQKVTSLKSVYYQTTTTFSFM